MSTYTAADARALLDGIFSAKDEEGVTAALGSFSPDVEWLQYDIANRPADPLRAHGHAEVATLLAKGLSPGMTHRIVRAMTGEDGIACHVECAYPSGDKVEVTYIFDVEDGRISRVLGTMAWDG
ncbi:MAG: nuclear transport factor 2 family protein [Thermoleophilia bacterium]|nr:nuclear transport factor 2 family protein [Thermoleophilia bacterium]